MGKGCYAEDVDRTHTSSQKCTANNKVKMIAFVADKVGDEVLDLPLDDVLDTVQEIPSDIWDVYYTKADDTTTTDTGKDGTEQSPREVMYTQLADAAAQHALIGMKSLTAALLKADLSDEKDDDGNSTSTTLQYDASQQSLLSKPTTKSDNSTPEKTQAFVSQVAPSVKRDDFEGIMVDNGAAGTPSGLAAYHRYCDFVGVEPNLRPSDRRFVGLGEGVVRSMGTATVRMPLGKDRYLDFETDIVKQDVPLMFGLDQFKEHGCSSDEYHNTFTHHPSGTTIPVNYKLGHLWVEWPVTEVMFTRQELRKLHDRFGHPTSRALVNLLKRAKPDEVNEETKKALQDLTSRCKACQTFAPKPMTFQVSMPADDIVFNHEIEVDLFWIEGHCALHIIDRGTRYSVAKFVERQSAEYLWNVIIDAWVTIFTGFPNIIAHDHGSAFESTFFKDACAEFGIVTKGTPTQSHNSLSICERYHSMIRRVFRKLRSVYPTTNRQLLLAISTHAVNSTAGPDGLTPTLLVFGSIPKLPIGSLNTVPSTQKERFAAMKTAREEMLRVTAERRLKEASKLRTRKPQHFIPQEGDKVRVYREDTNQFEGPFEVHAYDQRKTVSVVVNEGNGRTRIARYSLSQVKPWLEEDEQLTPAQPAQPNAQSQPPQPNTQADLTTNGGTPSPPPQYDATQPTTQDLRFTAADVRNFNQLNSNQPTLLDNRNDIIAELVELENQQRQTNAQPTRAYPVSIVDDPNDPNFDEAKVTELMMLLDKGTYIMVPKDEVPNDAVIMDSRFVLAIKEPESDNPTYKARFVILGHKDPDKDRVVNEAPTVLRSSVRMLIALSRIYNYPLWSRDVSQAFVQAMDDLKRELYIRVPKGQKVLETLGAEPGTLLKALKPLYGLCESPTYWWITFSTCHREVLKLQQTAMDPCLFYKQPDDEHKKFRGAQAVLVDDTLGTGDDAFSENEKQIGERFQTKPRSDSLPLKFNGVVIEDHTVDGEVTVRMQQVQYANSITKLDVNFTPAEFAIILGKVAYVAASIRPDVSFYSAKLSQCKPELAGKEERKLLNEAVSLLAEDVGLLYRHLDITSLQIIAYADASFAGNADLTSQLGMAVVLKDANNRAALIHYGSWKCRRVTRSVLAAEVHAFAACLDWTLTFAHDLRNMTGLTLPVLLMTDSKCLFDTITKLSTVSEKRLLIDIAAIRETYTNGELTNVAHVASENNLADVLTKKTKSTLLTSLMKTGTLDHRVNQWILQAS